MLPSWLYPKEQPRFEELSEFYSLRFAMRHPVLLITTRLRHEAAWREPFWLRRGYVEWDRDCVVYALPGLHWLLRLYGFWERHRWQGERLAIRLGFFETKEEGGYFSEGRWTPRFWRTWEARVARAGHYSGRTLQREYERGLHDGEEQFIARCQAQLRAARADVENPVDKPQGVAYP